MSYTPTVDDVAALVPRRALDVSGPVGVFTSDTQPSDSQVSVLITNASREVVRAVGGTVPGEYDADARQVIALGAASLVELTFFPSQVGSEQSAYRELYERYLADLARLVSAVGVVGGLDGTGDVFAAPAFEYPQAQAGWGSRW